MSSRRATQKENFVVKRWWWLVASGLLTVTVAWLFSRWPNRTSNGVIAACALVLCIAAANLRYRRRIDGHCQVPLWFTIHVSFLIFAFRTWLAIVGTVQHSDAMFNTFRYSSRVIDFAVLVTFLLWMRATWLWHAETRGVR